MNERTKRILSYVACGLGGLALGVALLGGLSYCSVREKAEQTEVNTILTKKNAVGTTNSGYTSYTFSVPLTLDNTENRVYYKWYEFDYYTASLGDVVLSTSDTLESSTIIAVSEYVETAKTAYNMTANQIYLLVVEGYSNLAGTWGVVQWSYISFMSSTLNTNAVRQYSFVKTSSNYLYAYKLSESYNYAFRNITRTNILTYDKADYIGFNPAPSTLASVTYQDVESYYKELGYQEGYDEGETVGYNSGYADGFDDGSDNGLLFTDLGVNQLTWARSDMSWDSQTDTTATMKLFDFKDGENNSYYVSFTDYSLGGGTPMVEVYKNGTASNNIFARIARGTWNSAYTQLEVIPSTYLKFEFAQITTYYHNSIPNGWFTLSGIPANATGYEVGYQTGYREGYLASPGGQATENVFSLFTNAFDSVGGIFNLKIFGFLPLYWFFLTPIFIAIIALILRLVKH